MCLHLQQENIKANEVCKKANSAFGVLIFICVHVFRSGAAGEAINSAGFRAGQEVGSGADRIQSQSLRPRREQE